MEEKSSPYPPESTLSHDREPAEAGLSSNRADISSEKVNPYPPESRCMHDRTLAKAGMSRNRADMSIEKVTPYLPEINQPHWNPPKKHPDTNTEENHGN